MGRVNRKQRHAFLTGHFTSRRFIPLAHNLPDWLNAALSVSYSTLCFVSDWPCLCSVFKTCSIFYSHVSFIRSESASVSKSSLLELFWPEHVWTCHSWRHGTWYSVWNMRKSLFFSVDGHHNEKSLFKYAYMLYGYMVIIMRKLLFKYAVNSLSKHHEWARWSEEFCWTFFMNRKRQSSWVLNCQNVNAF